VRQAKTAAELHQQLSIRERKLKALLSKQLRRVKQLEKVSQRALGEPMAFCVRLLMPCVWRMLADLLRGSAFHQVLATLVDEDHTEWCLVRRWDHDGSSDGSTEAELDTRCVVCPAVAAVAA